MAVLSNKTLVQQLKNGERLACTRLVDLYQDRLVEEAVLLFHVPSQDAEELVSDVLLSVVRSIHTFQFKRSESDFHVWVITVFRNKVRDFVRKQSGRNGVTLRFDESASLESEPYSRNEREIMDAIVRQYREEIEDAEEVETASAEHNGTAAKLLAIADTLDRLETWERVLLRCRALDVPYEDIAHYTNKPVSQLKVYHARVKKKFAKTLAQYYPELLGHEKRTS